MRIQKQLKVSKETIYLVTLIVNSTLILYILQILSAGNSVVVLASSLLLSTLVMALAGKIKTKCLFVTINAAAGMSILGLLLLFYGWVQDRFGVICKGFFGVQISCVEGWIFDIGLFLYPISIILILALAIGWSIELKLMNFKNKR